MAVTVATIDVGGTSASDVPTALANLGAANVAAYAQANSAYAAANNRVLKAGDTLTGALLTTSGSNTAPAVALSSNSNTGIYFPSNTEVAVSVGGTVAAAFNNGGVFFRNRIINGDMRIDQRNAGASVTLGAGNVYCLDRFVVQSGAASKLSVQQNAGSVTPPTGFTNYLGLTSLSAYTVGAGEIFALRQYIEGFNVADFAFGGSSALTITLSFWVRSSLTGTFGGSIDNNSNRSYPFTYTISAANTWEKKTITIAGDTTGTWATNATAGMVVQFGLGVGSTYSGTAGAWAGSYYSSATGATSVVGTNGATFYITGVQLETGSVATPFERRPYGMELMLCQRYYQYWGASNNDFQIRGYNTTGSNITQTYTYPVTMRVAPTIVIGTVTYSNGSGLLLQGNARQGLMAFAITTTGDGYVTASAGNYITFSAEL